MLRDRTADALRNRAANLRNAATLAEDMCVQERMHERAAEFDQLATVITPVLSPDEKHAN